MNVLEYTPSRTPEIGRPMNAARSASHLAMLASAAALVATAMTFYASEATYAKSTNEYIRPGLHLDYQSRVFDVELDRIGIRFHPDTGARIRNGEVHSTNGTDLSEIRILVDSAEPVRIEPRFPKSEQDIDRDRRLGEFRTGHALPDLNLFALLTLPSLGNEDAERERLRELLESLNAAPEVSEAWALPIATTARFEQVHLQAPQLPQLVTGGTPDFSAMQGYLYSSPSGINAETAWSYPGGMGQGLKSLDLEWGWLWSHEDLKPAWYYSGPGDSSDHGTAVLGEFGGQHNGFGVNGIAPEMEIGGVHLDDIAARVSEAVGVLDPGDIYLMEVQVGGPENWMPVEWWPDVYAAIEIGSALGVICIEAGGNGTVNLDDPLYGDTFDRRVRDSGAIMVGAGTPTGLSAEWFTNYGSRCDLNGWGSGITTTGYGDLQGGVPDEHYTAGFNGTSGASPIVLGAVASLQGQAIAAFGTRLTPDLAEEILSATGTPWVGTKQIGERPDLVGARSRLMQGFGDLTVTVVDGVSESPLAGKIVQIVESGRIAKTGPSGGVSMQLSGGATTLRIEGDFYYPDHDFPYVVVPGTTAEIELEIFPSPFGTISGRVRTQSGGTIAGATVEILETPIEPTTSDGSGGYEFESVPERSSYAALAFGIPGRGVDFEEIAVVGGLTSQWSPVLLDAETFEETDGGYAALNEWEWGTPTFPVSDPVPTFSGDNVWGVNLGGPYGDVVTSTLTSPILDVSESSTLRLSFHHWYWIDPDDGGQLQVWDESQSRWVAVDPIGGYPDDSIIVLLNTGGYNGHTTAGYVPAIFDLSNWIGEAFQFRFYFRSTASGHKLGWYLDDIALDTGQGDVVSIELSPLDRHSRVLWAGPSPTRGQSQIAFSLEAASPAQLDIYTTDGKRIRSLDLGVLSAGEHRASWDGRGESGERLGSGIYFYQLRSEGERHNGRFVRLR